MEIAVTDVGNSRFTPFCHRTFSCQFHAFDDFGSFFFFWEDFIHGSRILLTSSKACLLSLLGALPKMKSWFAGDCSKRVLSLENQIHQSKHHHLLQLPYHLLKCLPPQKDPHHPQKDSHHHQKEPHHCLQ